MNKILSDTIQVIREKDIDSVLEAGITSLIHGIYIHRVGMYLILTK